MFGLPADAELDQAGLLKLLHAEDRERTEYAVQQSLDPKGSGKYSCDYRVVRPDGEIRWIAATGRVLFSDVYGCRTAARLVGTLLDITGLRQTDACLRETEKLAATGRLAASLAHEINNPLEAITNLLYLLQGGSLVDEQRRYVELAEQELSRVIEIATQALRFYRDPGAPTQCDVAEIIDSVLALFGRRIEGSGILVERRYCSVAFLLGAREELRQVLVNLVHNAMDAMPRGGRLLIRIKPETGWRTRRKGIRLIVADTGHGMDPVTMKRMFEPFFTTRTSVGTGLGLWLSAGMIQKHGGTIRVKSRQHPNRSGTVFSIFLPFDRRQ
jgi:signal transduction histidine kinase